VIIALKFDMKMKRFGSHKKLMSILFDVHLATINEHLKNIYTSGEITKMATIRKFLIVQKEGNRGVVS